MSSLTVRPHLYQELSPYCDAAPVKNKIHEAVKSRPLSRNIHGVAEGLFSSKIFLTAMSAALVGLGIALLFLLVSNPAGWIAGAAGVSLLAAEWIIAAGAIAAFALIGAVAQYQLKSTIGFELSPLRRLTGSKPYDEIPLEKSSDGHKLFLGTLPNAVTDYKMMQEVVQKGGTVIALNEDWELEPHGLLIPMERQDYAELGIHWVHVQAIDHTILTPQTLDTVADLIHELLKKGNVYIHCLGGVGRSATAVAAYLMKYQDNSIEKACALLKKIRRNDRIWNKIHGLRRYQNHYELKLPKLSPHANATANYLEELEAAGNHRPNLPKKTIDQLQSSTAAR